MLVTREGVVMTGGDGKIYNGNNENRDEFEAREKVDDKDMEDLLVRREEAKEADLSEPDVVDSDFLRLAARHLLRPRRLLHGSLLLTPRALLFDPRSGDPLDSLEPELFLVAFPLAAVQEAELRPDFCGAGVVTQAGMRAGPGTATGDLFLQLSMDTACTAPGYISSYGSGNLLPSYWFLLTTAQADQVSCQTKSTPHLLSRCGCSSPAGGAGPAVPRYTPPSQRERNSRTCTTVLCGIDWQLTWSAWAVVRRNQ